MNPEQLQQQLGDSKASLGFSNMLREQMFQQENPQQSQSQPTPPVAQQDAPQPPQPQELDISQDNKESDQIAAKIQQLEDSHKADLEALKSSMKEDNLKAEIKSEYEKKIADMEKKHAKEMKTVKDEIKSILNG